MMDPARLESVQVMRKKKIHLIILEVFPYSYSYFIFFFSSPSPFRSHFSYNILLFFYTLASQFFFFFLHNIWSNLYVFPGSTYMQHKKGRAQFSIFFLFFLVYFSSRWVSRSYSDKMFSTFLLSTYRRFTSLHSVYVDMCFQFSFFLLWFYNFRFGRKNRYSINILTHWLVELISIVIWCFDCYRFCLLDVISFYFFFVVLACDSSIQ